MRQSSRPEGANTDQRLALFRRCYLALPSPEAWVGYAVAPGLPMTMGSKRIGRIGERPVILDERSASLRNWQRMLGTAMGLTRPPSPVDGAVAVLLVATLPRPKSHFGEGRNAGRLRLDAPRFPAAKPDLDKILRAVGDCMSGLWVVDDCRIARWHAAKEYAGEDGLPRTEVWSWALD